MANAVRLFLALVVGLLVGAVVNMALVVLGPLVIPPPPGADVTTEAGLRAALPLFEPRHYVFPFLAHALGTFAGALTAALIARGAALPAYAVAAAFLAGGIANAFTLPGAAWFDALDILAAYLPAAWLAHRIASRRGMMRAPAA